MPDTLEAPPTVVPASPENETVQPPLNDSFGKAFDDYFPTDQPEPKPGEKPSDKPAKKDGQKEDAPEPKESKKPAEDKPKPDDQKPEDKKLDDKQEEKKPDPDKPVRKTAWQLVHDYEKEIAQLRKQVKGEPAEDKIDEHPRFKEVSAKLEAEAKRRQELEDRIKYVDYSASPEYKDKYETPFVDAYMAGRSKVASMTVLTDDAGGFRKGTAEDFDAIMGIMSDDEAAVRADSMFGSKAPLVLYHREKVMELNQARNKALDEYRSKGSEMEKTTREAQAKFSKETGEQIAKYWKTHVEGPREKFAQYAKPIDGDEKGNQLLEKGYERAHKAFSNLNPMDPKLSPEQREEMVRLHGVVINKAAWFDRVVYQKQAIETELKEAKAKLAEYEKSEPKGGTDRRPKDKNKQPTWEEQMDSLAR